MSKFTLLLLFCTFSAGAHSSPVHSTESVAQCAGDYTLGDYKGRPYEGMDTIPPVISCPANTTLSVGPTNCEIVFHYTVSASDNVPGVIVAKVYGIASGQLFPAGTTTNLFIAVDAAGNTSTCSFTVQVVSNPPSSVSCKDELFRSLGSTCTLTLPATEFLFPPFGCLDAYLAEVDFTVPFGNGPWLPASFGPNDLGKTYQFRVTNLTNGNKCWGDITLRDSLPPALTCTTVNIPCAVPSEHLTPTFLHDSIGIPTGKPAVLDNCPGVNTLTFTDNTENLPCGTPGGVTANILRTWVVRDVSGNSATCLQTINRVRSIVGVQFPDDVTVFCTEPDAAPTRTGGPYTAVGGRRYSLLTAPVCEIDAFYDDSLEVTCGGGWRIRRVWDVRDVCLPVGPGNPIVATQYIEVRDTSSPTVQCPANVLVQIKPDSTCQVSLNLPDITVSDNCSRIVEATAFWSVGALIKILPGSLNDFAGNDPAVSDTLAVFDTVPVFPTGITEVLYVFSDACGNISSCTFLTEVWDSIPPVAGCDSLLTVFLGASGQAALPAELADNGSADACGETAFKIRRVEAGACVSGNPVFSDILVLCCADAGDTVEAILRVYDVAVPPGEAQEGFGIGQFSECTVRVVAADTLGPACSAPPDVVTTCDVFVQNLNAYGVFSSSCAGDSILQITDYTQFDSFCRSGTIVRHFRAIDSASGLSRSCSQTIEVSNTTPQHYIVRFPDDKIITMCDSSGSYGVGLQWIAQGCENIVATYTDELFTVVPDACYKVERLWTVYNSCTYNPNLPLVSVPNPNPNPITNHPNNLPGPVVSPLGTAAPWAPTTVAVNPGNTPTNFSTFWNANANGYTYKQIIKVLDNQKPTAAECPTTTPLFLDNTDNDPGYWNASNWFDPVGGLNNMCDGPVDLCFTATDLCSGSEVTIRYVLFLDLDINGSQETAVSSTLPFTANVVYYGNAFNPNYAGGTPRQFDFRSVPSNQKYGFSIQTTTNGRDKTACLRWRNVALPTNYVLPQLPYGTHRIRWTAEDACGNATSCEYSFSVQNAAGICGAELVPIDGNIRTEAGAGIVGVEVNLNRALPSVPDWSKSSLTDSNGDYNLEVPTGGSYTITPEHDNGPLNGVSTLDMLFINKHILGQDTLDSPYKMIAADANKSRSITTFDIVELRKLILGVYNKLPNNTSWRFVDASFVFPNPENPLQTVFPETQSGIGHSPSSPPTHDFIGLKVGDVNGNASPGFAASVVEARDADPSVLILPDITVQTGDVFEVPFAFASPVSGFQLTMALPELDVLDIRPGSGMWQDNFAVFPGEGVLTASWIGSGLPAFVLRLRARFNGRLSERIHLTHQIAQSEAYRETGSSYRICDLALRFGTGDNICHPVVPELYQNRPNPVGSTTVIRFFLPEACTATLRVYSPDGRELYARSAYFPNGLHSIELTRQMLGDASGVLHYCLETEQDVLTKRMILFGP